MKPEQIKRWRKEHPEIDAHDDALAGMPDVASLYANDFIAYLQSKEVDQQIIDFLKSLHRECVWLYGNWEKAQRDADPSKLLGDVLNNASGAGYDFTQKFLRDYMHANNIQVPLKNLGGFDLDDLPGTRT